MTVTLKERVLSLLAVRCTKAAAVAAAMVGNQVTYHDARCHRREQVDQHAFLESCQATGVEAQTKLK